MQKAAAIAVLRAWMMIAIFAAPSYAVSTNFNNPKDSLKQAFKAERKRLEKAKKELAVWDKYQAARNYLDAGQYAIAIRELSAVVKQYKEFAPAHRDLGVAYMGSGKPAKAITHLKAANRRQENNKSTLLMLGCAYAMNNQPKKGIPWFSKLIELYPEGDTAYLNRAHCYDKISKEKKALEDYETAMKNKPGCVQAKYGAATMLAKLDRNKEAIELFRQLVDDMPKNPDYLFNMGHCFYNEADFRNAERCFTRCIALDNVNAKAYYLRGRALLELKDPAAACTDLRMATRLAEPDAKKLYKKYCVRR